VQKYFFLLLFGSLAACATRTDFREQRDAGDTGYHSTKLNSENSFEAVIRLDRGVTEKYGQMYEQRAGGELCAKRGLTYFEVSTPFVLAQNSDYRTEKVAIFCYNIKMRSMLNVTFVPPTPDSKLQLIVADIPEDPPSVLKIGDQVTGLNGQKINSVFDFKKVAREGFDRKIKAFDVEFLRGGRAYAGKLTPVKSEMFILDAKALTEARFYTQ
jgi:hypothetical protein